MRWFLSLQMLLGPQLLMAQTDSQAMTPIQRQLVASWSLDEVLPKLQRAKKFSQLEALLPKNLSPKSIAFLRRTLGGKTLPRFVRLNRGIGFQGSDGWHTLTIADPQRPLFQIDDRVDFAYQEQNDFEVQSEVLRRALQKKFSFIDLALPKAYAITGVDIAIMIVIGAILTPVISRVVSDIGGDYLWEKARAWWCKGKSPNTSYEDSTFCAKYFKWVAENREPVMPKGIVNPDPPKLEATQVTHICRSSEHPKTVATAKIDNNKATTEIQFKPDGSVSTIQVIVTDPNGYQINNTVINIGDDSLISTVTENNKIIVTTDKAALKALGIEQATANSARLKKIEEYIYKPALDLQKRCNAEAEQTIKAAAEKPASDKNVIAVAPQFAPSPLGPPVAVPASGTAK